MDVTTHDLIALQFFIRLLIGAALGVAIGLERQWRHSPAGLHTSGLVATGAALFAMIGPSMGSEDTRILGGIVTGVGFISGGVILRQGMNVRGLNTAATMWATAAVGALAGLGLYSYAIAGAAAIILMNWLLQPLVVWVNARANPNHQGDGEYELTIRCSSAAQGAIRSYLVKEVSNSTLALRSMGGSVTSGAPGETSLQLQLSQTPRNDELVESLAGRVATQPGVSGTTWRLRDDV